MASEPAGNHGTSAARYSSSHQPRRHPDERRISCGCENLRLRGTYADDPALQSGVTFRTQPLKAEPSSSDFNSEAGIGYGLRFEG